MTSSKWGFYNAPFGGGCSGVTPHIHSGRKEGGRYHVLERKFFMQF
jgi:hypothetical protein